MIGASSIFAGRTEVGKFLEYQGFVLGAAARYEICWGRYIPRSSLQCTGKQALLYARSESNHTDGNDLVLMIQRICHRRKTDHCAFPYLIRQT